MEDGAQPAAGGHWLAAAPPIFRDRVVHKITKNLPQVLRGRQVDDLHGIAQRYEDSVFTQSDNLQDYFRTISMKMRLQQNLQPVASGHQQQQAHVVGHQMRPVNADLANSSPPMMLPTASRLLLTVRPHQVQNMHIKANQAEPSFATPVAPPQCQHAPRIHCDELPRIVNITGVKDNSQQKHEEQPAVEALPQSSQNVPAESPLAQQQNHSDHLAGEAENGEAHRVAQVPVAVNLIPGDTAPFTGGTYCQQIPQEDPTDEAVPQLTQNVDPAGSSPAQQQTHPARVEAEDDSVKAEAETPAAKTYLSPAALRRLASDMGVNLKRAFRRHTAWGTMEGNSCVRFDDEPSGESFHKRRKTHGGALLDEIRAAYSMLVETAIRISEDDTGEADGTVIELCYNAVSLAPDLRAVIGASEISTKLLVPADYPQSSPVILGCDGDRRKGVPGVVDLAFQRALGLLPEPRSIEGMARAWDCIVRRAVVQFAHRHGGGTFSTRYGRWESIPV